MKTQFFLLILCLFYFNVHSQIKQADLSKAIHDCAFSRINNTQKGGTYDQNILMWDYDITFYALDLIVEPTSTEVAGSVRIVAKSVTNGLETFVVELMNQMTVTQVFITSEEENLDFQHSNNELVVDLQKTFDDGEIIDVTIEYFGTPESEGFFSGIQSGTAPTGHPVLWTLSEPLNARKWFPVKQVLEDKADSVYVFITTSSQYVAASNGLLHNIVDLDNNKTRYEWRSYYPITYYLISIAVSEYREYNFDAPVKGQTEAIWIQNFIYDDDHFLSSIKDNLYLTKDYMALFSLLYGNYPFASEKYGHASAPMGGAMEHQTLSTMGSFNPDIISHELAHHWFGNQVTCATWSDIWINEGFATYSEYITREFLFGEDSAKEWMLDAHSRVLQQPDGSVYVPPLETSNVWRIFNSRLSYRKGAAILHTLRHEINDDDLFFEIFRSFQERYKHNVATGDDFMREVELLTGLSWEWFFDQWYYGEGHPIYNIVWYQLENLLFINVNQTTSAEYPHFFKATLEFELENEDESSEKIRIWNKNNNEIFEMPVAGEIKNVIFDPNNNIIKEVSLTTLNELIGQSKVLVFPNPFYDELTIVLPGDSLEYQYAIFSISGSIILEGELHKSVNKVNTDLLPEGIYLLTIQNKSYHSFHKQKLIKINR